ncbi:multicopper oxidase family protein [Pseudonocardia abyssalis]|uniref:Multicopper oxidase family protein n=1 Tax=Pseudonocardia abyssalis TaxID=2792008 RepID=A0ABS6UKH1_9PSEU|nr:multicopper oxidase family protein [Pseudonocardia abyssalis]MBW0119395.1 multicopper oxidase family protein [Pseudonocardia abyssalis]MBW0132757.1 multicopper oxidase family protein [Pseudonocardia abyssalis]
MTSRRQFLRLAGAGAGLLALGACAGPTSGTLLSLGAGEVGLDLAGTRVTTWGYDGTVPGPEIRLRAGETLRVPLVNALPEPTTVHWHGISLPNAMDGTPGLTQPPIAPGTDFEYAFTVPDAGTHWYHAHSGHQLDRGLYGALIVEPAVEELSYDREYTLLLDDWRDGVDTGRDHAGHDETEPPAERVSFGGRFYPLMLVNARPPADPAVFDVRRGDRVRLRVINAAADTGFRFAIDGHPLTVTHGDGMPVRPVSVDALRIGMGERYDVLVDASEPGAWQIGVLPEGKAGFGRAVLRYADAPATATPPADAHPAGLDGRLLTYDDLVSTGPEEVPTTGGPDRTFALTLRGTDIDVDGLGPDEPLPVHRGEWVRITVRNESAVFHPVHLHGHHFQLATPGRALKDTAVVAARGGALTFDWRADNPGEWMIHCHNHHHMEDGMMRTIGYR